jgi:hypothetical protein
MSIREFLGGDLTPIEHVVYAALIQAVVTLTLWWFSPLLAVGAGAGVAVGFFFGREHAQQQDYFSGAEDAELGDWEAAKFWKWDYASKMDIYCPTVTTLLLACLALLAVLL